MLRAAKNIYDRHRDRKEPHCKVAIALEEFLLATVSQKRELILKLLIDNPNSIIGGNDGAKGFILQTIVNDRDLFDKALKLCRGNTSGIAKMMHEMEMEAHSGNIEFDHHTYAPNARLGRDNSWNVALMLEPSLVPIDTDYRKSCPRGTPKRVFIRDIHNDTRRKILELAKLYNTDFKVSFCNGFPPDLTYFFNVMPPQISEYGYVSDKTRDERYMIKEGVGFTKAPETCQGRGYCGDVEVSFMRKKLQLVK